MNPVSVQNIVGLCQRVVTGMGPVTVKNIVRLCQGTVAGMNPVTLQKATNNHFTSEHLMSDSTVHQYQKINWSVTG